jgi:prepilin signal peptidase PulO-like enzyme (type II secretory pathway)
MERWERTERVVLLVACACLLGASLWLAFTEEGVRLLLALVPLPFAFWTCWQALYEDKLGTAEAPSTGERVLHSVWLGLRRVLVGMVAAAFGSLAFLLALQSSTVGALLVAGLFGLLALLAFWVAVFGGGRLRSMSDDTAAHRFRLARYARRSQPRE